MTKLTRIYSNQSFVSNKIDTINTQTKRERNTKMETTRFMPGSPVSNNSNFNFKKK